MKRDKTGVDGEELKQPCIVLKAQQCQWVWRPNDLVCSSLKRDDFPRRSITIENTLGCADVQTLEPVFPCSFT